MLSESARAAGYRLIVRDEVASTMEEARRALGEGDPGRLWIVAKSQNAGRGRHGRHWGSPPGNLYASLLLVAPCEPALAPQLGFVAGLALHDAAAAVTGLSHPALALKWPNDLLIGGAKTSGLLLEGENRAGRFNVVIGIGVNVRLSESTRARIGQTAADLDTACGAAPDRNRLLAGLLIELDRVLEAFGRDGFAAVRDEWQRRHAQQDRRITLTLADGQRRSGRARGVAEDGALLVETPSGMQRFHSGEISLRAHRQ